MLARFFSGSVVGKSGLLIASSLLMFCVDAPIQAQHSGHMGGAGGAHHSGGSMSGGMHHAGGSMTGGSHHGGSTSGSHHHGGGSYYGGFGGVGIGGFGYPYGVGYSSFGLSSPYYGRSYSNSGLGYSNYGYSARPSYSAPVYNYYTTPSPTYYYQPTPYNNSGYSNSGYSASYSNVPAASASVTLNPDGTPAGELRPGMVLPDGAIVISVGTSTPGPTSKP